PLNPLAPGALFTKTSRSRHTPSIVGCDNRRVDHRGVPTLTKEARNEGRYPAAPGSTDLSEGGPGERPCAGGGLFALAARPGLRQRHRPHHQNRALPATERARRAAGVDTD